MTLNGAPVQWIIDFVDISPTSPTFLAALGTPGTVWDPETGSTAGGRHAGEFMASSCAGQSTGGSLSIGTGTITCMSKSIENGVTTAIFKWGVNATGQDQAGAFKVIYRRSGNVTLTKSSSRSTVTNSNSNYDLTGAKYTLYTDANCTTIAKDLSGADAVLTVNSNNGTTNTVEMLADTYYMKETAAGTNYNLDPTVYTVAVTSGSTTALNVEDTPLTGYIRVQKTSSATWTSGNNNYTFSGIQFKVYTDDTCATEALNADGAAFTLTVNAEGNGYTGSVEMPIGTYYVREVESSLSGTGYGYNSNGQWVTVTAGNTSTAPATGAVANTPQTGYLRAMKMSGNPTITSNNGCYEFSGIQFNVYKDFACTTRATDVSGNTITLTTGSNGITASVRVPLGTYYVREVESSILNKGWRYNPNAQPAAVTVTNTSSSPAVAIIMNTPVNDPFGIELVKEAAVNGYIADLSGAEYTIKYYAGQYSSVSALPSSATQTWVIKTIQDGNAFAARLHDSFLVSGISAPYGKNMATGAYNIPLGTLTVEETKAPYGYAIDGSTMKDQVSGNMLTGSGNVYLFNLTSSGQSVTLVNGNVTSDAEEGVHILQSEQPLSPEISTKAINEESETNHMLAGEAVKIIDTVAYKYLFQNTDYVMIGTLVDAETGEPLLNGEGNPITERKEFTTGTEDFGTVEVSFEIDATSFAGRPLVVFEKLMDAEGKVELATHEDKTDEGQTIWIPEIHTTAIGADTEDHVTFGSGTTIIYDDVAYTGLKVGETYTIIGMLYDQETEEPLLEDGEPITVKRTFICEQSDGVERITFDFNGVPFLGTTTVAFEELFYEDKLVGVHADINDESQTVYIPDIGTHLWDQNTGVDHSLADTTVTLTDTVTYSNLLPGKEYAMKGTLVNKKTGEPIKDANGEIITKERKFTPDAPEGFVNVIFTIDSSLLKIDPIVAFESCYYNGIEVAVHADIEDEKQSVYIPEIKTTAMGADTNEHLTEADEEVEILDVVEYKGLKPETTYVVTGTLMDKETGKELLDAKGKTITETQSFVTEKAKEGEVRVDGSKTLSFKFDGSHLAGKATVVFENLYQDGKLVAVHADITDEGQTVYFADLQTTATDKATGTHSAHLDKNVTIEDEVAYKNLIVGKEYTLTGTLMVKDTGKPLIGKDGKPVTKKKPFTPDKPEGATTITFEDIDTTLLIGKELVAFEKVDLNGITVCAHEDLEDERQTVIVPELKTKAYDKKKGKDVLSYGNGIVVMDKITYSGLTPGAKYTVKGVLVDKETGKETEIRAEVPLTPKDPNGEFEIEYVMDVTVELKDKSFVIFEEIYDEKGNLMGEHKDIDDKDQTVRVVIGTADVRITPRTPGNPASSESPMSPIMGITKNFTPLLTTGLTILVLIGMALVFISVLKRGQVLSFARNNED